MKKLIYILLCLLLMACRDEVDAPSDTLTGRAMRFEATVIDQPQTRGQVLDVNDNNITHDFYPGDSFGLFIIDGNNNFVTHIDNLNALNIKLTTPDGKAWNLDSDIKEVVHKLGYRYVAYFPYSEAFNDCTSPDDIRARLTAPATDQRTQAATDWMYTEITSPGINAVTTLQFKHRYAKIEIYNSFTQEHTNNWDTQYLFTKTIDRNKVERYRYILNAETETSLSIQGTYTIGNYLTGMKEFSYNCGNIAIQNGRHAIVYTYRMDERCAIDLGLPSGVKWSPINLGTETSTYMDETAIATASNLLGKRLAWGELFVKDTYSDKSYINYQDNENTFSPQFPADIAETVYDPVRQYWGGHWTMPSNADLLEFKNNTEIVKTETVYSTEIGMNIKKITFRSKINGNEITLLSNGYINNSTLYRNENLYYMSSTRYGNAYYMVINDNPTLNTYSFSPYYGIHIRPVLKELDIHNNNIKKDIVVRHINDLAVDLGITKTVTENSEQVTYKLLWSPFNYGVDSKILTYNRTPIIENKFLENCLVNPGMRLPWGYLEEPESFSTKGYADGTLTAKYNYDNAADTDKDKRDLKAEDDIVKVNWPAGWCIPSAKDFELLCENITVTKETIDNNTWFRLKSKKNGNSILIPGTGYIDDLPNTEKWTTETYLQSSTIGTINQSVSGTTNKKRTIYALKISINNSVTTAKVVSNAGRPTGLMIRPVKYVRVNN